MTKKKHKTSSTTRKSPTRDNLRCDNSPRDTSAVGGTRIASLDALRGLAIVLMIVDHCAFYLWDIPIAPTTLRIVTRLSMPLFCGLMGYFLAGQTKINWKRFYQLCLATVLVNLAFFSVHHKLEILASLLICYGMFICLRNWLSLAVVAVFLTPLDPSVAWFDYPLPIVLSCVAQGIILRRHDLRIAVATGALVTLGALVVSPPSVYVLFYVIPVSLLIAGAARRSQPDWSLLRLEWLCTLGRYPLSIYVVQYWVVLAIHGGRG